MNVNRKLFTVSASPRVIFTARSEGTGTEITFTVVNPSPAYVDTLTYITWGKAGGLNHAFTVQHGSKKSVSFSESGESVSYSVSWQPDKGGVPVNGPAHSWG